MNLATGDWPEARALIDVTHPAGKKLFYLGETRKGVSAIFNCNGGPEEQVPNSERDAEVHTAFRIAKYSKILYCEFRAVV